METISPSNYESLPPSLEDVAAKAPNIEKKGLAGLIEKAKAKYFPANSANALDRSTALPQIEAIDHVVEELTSETLRKVGSQLGSNEGGWYEHPSSNERFYLKFYENPDQAKVEFIANSIYAKLGIKTVKSELVEADGREAISSPEITGSQPTYREDQKASHDVRGGFVADAYLANWDVVGLNYDNIMQGEDGMYRVDNGGSLIFRAQGGSKQFSPHDIPELHTMLNPDFTAGQVFEGITKQEMAEQARTLVEKLDVASIDAIIAESELTGEAAAIVREGLVGRRDFLIQHFNLNSRLGRVMERLDQSKEAVGELGIRTREVVISDSHHVENQEVNFIDARDTGHIIANFKLTSEQYDTVVKKLEALGEKPNQSTMRYESINGGNSYNLSDAYQISRGELIIKVASGTLKHAYFTDEKEEIRAAIGLVNIEIPYAKDHQPTTEEMESHVNDVLINLLGVTEGLAQPTPEAERRYKEARYYWQNKANGPLSPEQISEIEKLKRQEVFPSYYTMVSENKHLEYESRYGEFAVYHNLLPGTGADRVIQILQHGGLMSTHERFRRGLMTHGMSSMQDFKTGGADSVFTRTILDNTRSYNATEELYYDASYRLIMGPELYDRTDWYAYNSDRFGATGEEFAYRQSPDELLLDQKTNGYILSNEQMFRTGISSKSFKAIGCMKQPGDGKELIGEALELSDEAISTLWDKGPDAVRQALASKNIEYVGEGFSRELASSILSMDMRMRMIDELHAAGYNAINGIPIEQFVVEVKIPEDYIDLAHGRPPRSKKKYQDTVGILKDTVSLKKSWEGYYSKKPESITEFEDDDLEYEDDDLEYEDEDLDYYM